MIDILADFVQRPPEEIDNICEGSYRVNSEYAKVKNIPRGVVVQLTSKKIRDEIFEKQLKAPLQIQDKKIRIMKKLPKEIIQRRKNYRKLIEELNSEQVRYRSLVPEGLSFIWKS